MNLEISNLRALYLSGELTPSALVKKLDAKSVSMILVTFGFVD